ncbi:MAG: hypothetical protein M1838_001915 [Thelocarpon superellum]|nr:MAG: hypothetical protein M1838_001915 [Thelocarpon superellum]
MANFLRGKQSGIPNDLSAGIIPELFALDDIARYGVNSQISAMAYDPVQSLLAVGTNESRFGPGQIYVFGQKRVSVTLNLPRRASVKDIRFCAEKLVSLDSKNDIAVFSLESKRLLTSYAPPGLVTVLLTDPTLDWAFLGLQNGTIVIYDLDRESLAPCRLPNFWRDQNPRARANTIVTLALHPRDIGTLLIGYPDGAVIYSFKQGKPTKFLQYEVPRGAPGGDSDPGAANTVRHPKLTHALWHPSGTFILTGHDDSSLVFWDPRTGKVITARTLQDTQVNMPGAGKASFGSTPGTYSLKEPFSRIAWCAKQNPEDTGILVAGGSPTTLPDKGLTFLDLGVTPNYATSSWQVLSAYFESPKRQHRLLTPPQADVVDFCLIARASPHYAGAHDPIAVVALLSSGEVTSLSFPSGHAISPTNQLHVSLSFVHPFVNQIALSHVQRTRWLGMVENRRRGPDFLMGGAGMTHPLRRFAKRNVVQTAHADGTIRVWDLGHGDEIENAAVVQVDVARALDRMDDTEVTSMSMAGATGELAVGMVSGDVVIFRWMGNPHFGREPLVGVGEPLGGLTDISDRADPALKEGLLPLTLLGPQQGYITALSMSDVGFTAVGYSDGTVIIIDLRGPAIISRSRVNEVAKPNKRGSIRRSNSQAQATTESPTVLEFGVMSLETDDYSSILLFVGTDHGRVLTMKLLPKGGGGYTVQVAGVNAADGAVLAISPVNVENGAAADANPMAVANLRKGLKVNGVILVTTKAGAMIFRPPSAKGAQKIWDSLMCLSAAVVEEVEGRGTVLVGIFGDGSARAFSVPGLREISRAPINKILDVARLSEAIITSSGDVVGWTGPSEIALLSVWGTGQTLPKSSDKMFNPAAVIPPRPTISNMEWISGTQFVSPSDLDVLIGGPDRPMSRRMIEQSRADEQQQRRDERSAGRPSVSRSGSSTTTPQDESYWGYMQRQLNERTEKLNLVGDSMDQLQENSAGWANDVTKYVNQQKRKMVMGAVQSKFGL